MNLEAEPLPGEIALLQGMPPAVEIDAPFRIEVTDAPGGPAKPLSGEDRFDSDVSVDGHGLHLTHRLFSISIDLVERRARVERSGGAGLALTHALRASLLALLPLHDGVALHSCGAVRADRAIVFHGRSGAGKTTLANTCSWSLLSDEIVVLRRSSSGWLAHPSGFWGGARPSVPVADEPARLVAMVALDKGAAYELSSLSRAETVRGLTASVHVPPSRVHWQRTLELLDALAASVPSSRMAWSPASPPWSALEALL